MPARGAIHSVPGRLWSPLVRQKDRSARSALDWDRRKRVTPGGAGSQETRSGAEPMLVVTGVASPRRSAGRRARPFGARPWRCRQQRCCRCSADNGWHAPFGAPPPFLFHGAAIFLRSWWLAQPGRGSRRGNVSACPPPRSGGRGTTRRVVEGACSKEVRLPARAPSTALTRGPLPRCAGQDEDVTSPRSRCDRSL